jgi:hypothetical protein
MGSIMGTKARRFTNISVGNKNRDLFFKSSYRNTVLATFPDTTTKITFKKRHLDGTLEDIDTTMTFEVGILDDCTLGSININGIDTNYYYGATQPVYFIADSSADSGTVLIRAALIEGGSSSKMIRGNLGQEQSEQTKTAKRYNIVLNKNTNCYKNKNNNELLGDNPRSFFCQTVYSVDAFGVGSLVVGKRYEIEILTPIINSEEWITKESEMPDVVCEAKLMNYDNGKITFEWEYWISYTLLRHEFKKIDTLMRRTGKIQICGKSYSNNSETTTWTVPFDKDSLKYVLLTVKQPEIPSWAQYEGDNNEKRTSWDEGDEIFFGGDVFLQITAKNNNGNIIGFKQQNSGRILGKNPFLQDVLNYITSNEFKAIVKHEAKSKQFNETYINKYNEKGYPIYGPPNGYGLAQIDNPPPLEMDLWNWKSNLNRGKSIYDDKKIDAYNFMEKHPNTYTEEMLLKCAFQKYNMYGYEEKTKTMHYFWRWDNYQGKWVDDEHIKERSDKKGFKERDGITIWNIYKKL